MWEMLRVASFNVNGMSAESKRKEVVEGVRKGRLDVIGVQETHMKGCGVREGLGVNECEIWKGWKEQWCGVV